MKRDFYANMYLRVNIMVGGKCIVEVGELIFLKIRFEILVFTNLPILKIK